MRAEPDPGIHGREHCGPAPRWCGAAVLVATVVGWSLMADSLWRSSATYDEVAYLRVAARWWRTGDQDEISRMGSPLTFWKIQQAPVLWALDRLGHRTWVDDPIAHQARLLPLVRLWASSLWLAALGLTALWSRRLYGPRAMALAAWLFALSPNLLAHGPLATMEMPLVACTTGVFLLFWTFLQTGRRGYFWTSAALAGLAWSCKFTTMLVPPLLAAIWWVDCWKSRGMSGIAAARRVLVNTAGFCVVMLAADCVVTGFATLPVSPTRGAHPTVDGRYPAIVGRWLAAAMEVPIPQDWVAFLVQLRHQHSGGSSYLLGERRMTGWWYYYFVALAVKVPLTFWLLAAARATAGRRVVSTGRDWILPTIIVLFLAITAVGSSRNYGIRYLLPLAPLAIVWVSGLAEAVVPAADASPASRGTRVARWPRRIAAVGLAGHALAILAIHPHELSYFNVLSGGPIGGRHVLADSNLDWGQGLRSLARMQRENPELKSLTLYYFGDTDAHHYGVTGTSFTICAVSLPKEFPRSLRAETEYLAVSASLQWGPCGPAGYFHQLDSTMPTAMTDDTTIAIYRVSDLGELARSPAATARSEF